MLHSSTAAGGGGTQKDAVSWCSADGNDYAYVEDLVYPPPGPPAPPAAAPAASPFPAAHTPLTVVATSRRADATSPGRRIMHHML